LTKDNSQSKKLDKKKHFTRDEICSFIPIDPVALQMFNMLLQPMCSHYKISYCKDFIEIETNYPDVVIMKVL